MSKLQKILILILCFAIFFSLGKIIYAADKNEKGSIKDNFVEIYQQVTLSLADLLVSIGDGVVHIVSRSVGEIVTLDKLIFNEVQKVSIDYWDDTSNTEIETKKAPIKAFMQPVVEKWYDVFFRIALIVYMVVLIYIGVQILFSSTAEKKANYKEQLITWFMGLTM